MYFSGVYIPPGTPAGRTVDKVVTCQMKPGIHPQYEQTTITCSCGATYEVGSTKKNIRVEICSHCHPLFTGGQARIVDTGGRVERFKRRYGV